MRTDYEKILSYLKFHRNAAVHEIEIDGMSQNNIATRLSEMSRMGLVVGKNRKGRKNRKGHNYKERNVQMYEKNGQGCLL